MKIPIKHKIIYYTILIIFSPIWLLSYRQIGFIGRFLGTIAYILARKHRKRALNNIAIAKIANSEKEMHRIAKESFQNLAITCMEFFRMMRSKDHLEEIIVSENPEILKEITSQKKGFVILSGHQANWEMLFWDLSSRHHGSAIGRPLRNKKLYQWILSMREILGGNIVEPKKTISQGIKELRDCNFIGIVGDQGLPESSYSYPLFGTRAWTSPSPALLAYRTACPIVVATTRRIKNKCHIHYSDPIWPNTSKPLREEIVSLMDKATKIFEDSVREHPGQWLWQHRRWKQQLINNVRKEYRHDFILVVLDTPSDNINILKDIYPRGFFYVMIPEECRQGIDIPDAKIITYRNKQEILVRDWRFQFVIDFTNTQEIRRHFLKLGAFSVINASPSTDFYKKLLRPGLRFNSSDI